MREELIEGIVAMELEMFVAVRPLVPSLCQERPETFRLMRRAAHWVLSDETLESYHRDLVEAVRGGRNLMTEKYARMDSLIPQLRDNAVIGQIVAAEGAWLKELAVRHPRLFNDHSEYAAGVYLRSELETYSDRTLELYYADTCQASATGRNLADERYKYLFRQAGYESWEELERKRK